jgi:aromatic ring-opening dioxygenase catalytic subunit (LigB family)
MATLVGCLAMSHAPQLMVDPDHWGVLNTRSWDPLPEREDLKSLTIEQKWEKWRRCHEAIGELRKHLEKLGADTLVIVGDDQHENLVDDNMPPFTVFIGEEVEASTSLRYFNQPFSDNRARYRVDHELGAWTISQLMEAGFDPSYSKHTRFEGGLGHAFGRPLKFMLPEQQLAVVPIMVNTYYPPAPSPKRCLQFGQALADAIERFPHDRKVAVLASGGLSHTKIDEALDAQVIDALQGNKLGTLAALPAAKLVEGTSEVRNWIVVAGAADRPAHMVEYKPLYRTTNGVGCAMGFAWWE